MELNEPAKPVSAHKFRLVYLPKTGSTEEGIIIIISLKFNHAFNSFLFPTTVPTFPSSYDDVQVIPIPYHSIFSPSSNSSLLYSASINLFSTKVTGVVPSIRHILPWRPLQHALQYFLGRLTHALTRVDGMYPIDSIIFVFVVVARESSFFFLHHCRQRHPCRHRSDPRRTSKAAAPDNPMPDPKSRTRLGWKVPRFPPSYRLPCLSPPPSPRKLRTFVSTHLTME